MVNIYLNLPTNNVSIFHQIYAPASIEINPVMFSAIPVFSARKLNLANKAININNISGFESVSINEVIKSVHILVVVD